MKWEKMEIIQTINVYSETHDCKCCKASTGWVSGSALHPLLARNFWSLQVYNQCHWQEETVVFLCFGLSRLRGTRLCWGFWSCVDLDRGLGWGWVWVGMCLACVQTVGFSSEAVVFSPDCLLQVSRASATCCQESVGVCELGERWEGKRERKHERCLQRGSWSWRRMSPSALVLSAVSVLSLCSAFLCVFFSSCFSHTQTTYLFFHDFLFPPVFTVPLSLW